MPVALRNTEPWSPVLFREGNYVDNAALLRRSTWERIGGFDEDQSAWEDYDRWLRVAALGGRAQHVPTMVMQYAVRRHSMSGTLSLREQTALRRLFARRYPQIMRGIV
jgi:GT2 family glycosyltransferase